MAEQNGASDQARIGLLEAMVSRLRHDLRGAVTPLSLVGDQLRNNQDPSLQRAGARIEEAVRRVVRTLEETYQLVPAREARSSGPVLGGGQTERQNRS